MKKLLNYLAENTWTWAGTGMVLITLSGPTFRQAVFSTGTVFNFGAIEAKEDLLFCFCDATLIFGVVILLSATSLSLQND